MAARSSKQTHTAPAQELTIEPITDPAEQAALEERLKRSREIGASVVTRGSARPSKPATASNVLELTRRLSAEERFLLVTKLAARLSATERLKLVERLAARLPADAHRKLQIQLRG